LPVLLGDAGYVSQLICDCPHLFPAGFNAGFSAAVAIRGQEGDIPVLRMNDPLRHVMPVRKTRSGARFGAYNLPDVHRWTNRSWRGEEDRFPPRTARMAVEWLEENHRHHPFFLWVDFFDPHEPWDPPEYMVRRYDSGYRGVPMIHPNYGRSGDYTKAELRNLRAHYCAEAELVDRWVGRVLQKVDDLDLWRNSIVVFTSDHGMSLGEHGRTGKTNINERDPRHWPLYPEIAHIPFLLAAPGLRGGREVAAWMQPVDVLPTLLDLAGVRVRSPEPIHGVSLADALRGRRRNGGRDSAVCGCFLRLREGRLPPKSVTPVFYRDQWAYAPIGADGRPELFDLSRDPAAERNMAARSARTVGRLQAGFQDWLRHLHAPPEAVEVFDRPA
jgi:arylsulfatase A-like enzyme